MEASIYLHHGKHLCAIVSAESRHKFIDNVEVFCPDWQSLIAEAKAGFPGLPFYDRYKNHDIDFWARYLDIAEGSNDDYEWLGNISDGVIIFSEEVIKDKGAFFAPLLTAIRNGTFHDFASIHDIVSTGDYILLSSDSEILACTNIKIPFEANSAQKALQSLIKTKLSSLRPLANHVFCAKYGCPSTQRPDIENALFYNIGTGSFRTALTKETSVYFQRARPTETRLCDCQSFQYFYHYRWVPKEKNKYWWERNLVCEWDHVPLAKVTSSLNPIDYYLAIKNHPHLVSCVSDKSDFTLGLKIQLFIPKSLRFSNVISVMKPMIDGVICAFHAPAEIAADRMCELLNINKEILLSSRKTCLGPWPYVNLHNKGASIKWNPQDDRLDFVAIDPIIVDDNDFSFSGQIFSIPCCM